MPECGGVAVNAIAKPKPRAEIVVTEHTDRALRISCASADSYSWALAESENYGMVASVGFIKNGFLLFVSELYDVQDVVEYLQGGGV